VPSLAQISRRVKPRARGHYSPLWRATAQHSSARAAKRITNSLKISLEK